MKRAVWRRILQGNVIIYTAEEFVKVAAASCPKIKVIFLSHEEINSMKDKLLTYWETNIPKTIEDTRKFHFFKSSVKSDTDMEVSQISNLTSSDCEHNRVTIVPVFRRKRVQEKPAQKAIPNKINQKNNKKKNMTI